jgi:outer membrane protein assembly factor BamA
LTWIVARARALRWWAVAASLIAGGCAQVGPATGPFPRFAEFAGREVASVRFAGDLRLPVDSLRAVTITRSPRCRIFLLPRAICPGFAVDHFRLDLTELARDVARLQLYHRDHGYYGTRVIPDVEPVANARVDVRFAIAPGEQVILRDLTVEGTEEIVPAEVLLPQLPIRVNEPFRRSRFLAAADTIRNELLQRGHAYAEVLRNYGIDTVTNVAEAHFVALPGPLVRVDSVIVIGATRLGERTVRRQLTFRETDLLRALELNRSQRALYGLGMVNFASVEVAPDTLQVAPLDSAAATVLVRVVEAPQYLVDATVGYGTVGCLRTSARWTDRNFGGGARRLELSGSLSKIGVGFPAGFGLEESLCRALREDPFSDTLNYRLAADFQQPRLFGTLNQLGVGLRAQRSSELEAYMRRVVGGHVALSRLLTDHTLVNLSANAEWGLTRATPAVFCVGFDVCAPEDRAPLQEPRWSNSLGTHLIHDRTTTEGFAVHGFSMRGSAEWATPAFGSDDEYFRLSGETVGHYALGPGWIVGGRLHAGAFLRGTLDPIGPFIPPDRRFYAGGPNSVRGFPRNALGPVVYVIAEEDLVQREDGELEIPPDVLPQSSATGGTRMVVATAELRTPSPVFSEYTRLGFFVDAGQVWAPHTDLATAPIRFTPGLGLRFVTPVGPIRVDAAYNAYGREAGPLYVIEQETGNLIQRPEGFSRPPGDFWDRFQIHFAIGHAF